MAHAVKNAGFEKEENGLDYEEIPLLGSGRVEYEPFEISPGRLIHLHEFNEELKKQHSESGFPGCPELANPLIVLHFARLTSSRFRMGHHHLITYFWDKFGNL